MPLQQAVGESQEGRKLPVHQAQGGRSTGWTGWTEWTVGGEKESGQKQQQTQRVRENASGSWATQPPLMMRNWRTE